MNGNIGELLVERKDNKLFRFLGTTNSNDSNDYVRLCVLIKGSYIIFLI
jgi:hypothetical protein